MTFLADEGVDRQIVERLRLDGHRVACVAEMFAGIMDEDGEPDIGQRADPGGRGFR